MARASRAVDATLAVRVPLNATGSLADGAARIVERIDAVEGVADPEVTGIQPGLNDTVVDLRVRVTLVDERVEDVAGESDEDVALARRTLADAVGVQEVTEVRRATVAAGVG